MDAWPFSKDEWDSVGDALADMVNASAVDDDVLCSSAKVRLFAILDDLDATHGPHPVLLETRADVEDLPSVRVRLYEGAIARATRAGLQTTTIRLSLAQVYLEELGDARAAKAQLTRCKKPMSPDDLAEWERLCEGAKRLLSG